MVQVRQVDKLQPINSKLSAPKSRVHVKCTLLPITGFGNTGLTYLEKTVRGKQITPIGEEIGYVLRKVWQESVVHRLMLVGSTELASS